MMRLVSTLILCLLLASTSAIGQTTTRKLELATELIRLLRVEVSYSAYLKGCSVLEGTPYDPKEQFRSDPGSFGGLSPQSAYWQEVEATYARFRQATCDYATPEKFAAFFIKHFAANVSEEDLMASVEFQSSPVGRRLQDALLTGNDLFQPFANRLMYEAYEVAREQFQAEMRAIQRKYRASPK